MGLLKNGDPVRGFTPGRYGVVTRGWVRETCPRRGRGITEQEDYMNSTIFTLTLVVELALYIFLK